ncbi:MAG: tyrosine-protein kinase family protein, partial [Spirulina sp. DLM2.Bin59]
RLAGARGKVVAVTSLEPGAGKSVTAYNLAIAAAHAGQRTLIIEADLRSPSHAPSLNITVDPDAASEPLSYYGAIHTCTALAPDVANLYLIPSAGPQAKAAMILEASELSRLLKDARSRYDLVIVDTPALEQCNDALLLQPLIDGLLFITRPGITLGKPLGTVLDQLVEDEVPLLGGVINGSETVARPITPPLSDTRNLYADSLPNPMPAPALKPR